MALIDAVALDFLLSYQMIFFVQLVLTLNELSIICILPQVIF